MRMLTCLLLWTILPISLQAAPLFSLHAPIIEKNNGFPVEYTCDGNNISPALTWSGAPQATKTFVLVLSDPDAPGGTFYHWGIYNIPHTVTSLAKNMQKLPKGAAIAVNSWQKSAYNGPCPPVHTQHHYIFTLYALSAKLHPAAEMTVPALLMLMQDHLLAKTHLKTSFGH